MLGRHLALIYLAIGLTLGGCQREETDPVSTPPAANTNTATPALATELFWQQGQQLLRQARGDSEALRDQVRQLLHSPNREQLASSQQAWHRAHNSYQQLGLIFALGTTSPGLFGSLQGVNFSLDAQPIQPGYIDYFDVYRHSGLVNDISLAINPDSIRQQHGLTDNSDACLGFHAMAYLLWGEQGQRPVTDLQASQTAPSSEALEHSELPNNRRRALLQLQAELLLDDLSTLERHWSIAQSDLQKNYLALQPRSRQQLLQAASRQLLNQLLSDEISTDEELDSDQQLLELHHSNSRAGLLARLKGLESLINNPQAPLINHWLNESAQQQWQTAISESTALLQAQGTSNQNNKIEPDKLKAIAEQLSQLMNLLSAPETSALNEP